MSYLQVYVDKQQTLLFIGLYEWENNEIPVGWLVAFSFGGESSSLNPFLTMLFSSSVHGLLYNIKST